jgi:hypothetical protein
MKIEKDIRVEMVRMEGDVAPFVQVDYMDKEAQEHTGLMLLDSGSTVNVLSSEMAGHIGKLCLLKDECTEVSSFAPNKKDFDNVSFSFALGGKVFKDTFCLCDKPMLIKVRGMEVIGLVGTKFLRDNHLVIDYGDFTLHTSHISPENLAIAECDFFFPMEIGIKHYQLPVLSVKQKGKVLVTLLDTGSANNMIAKQTLTENEFKCQYLKDGGTIETLTGEVGVDSAFVCFNMLSLEEDGIREISGYDNFKVLPHYIYPSHAFECETGEEQVPPIELLIGAAFMAAEGWTLDFDANIIYRLKAA